MNPYRALLSCLSLVVLLSNGSYTQEQTTSFAGFQLTSSGQTLIQPYLTIPTGTPSNVNVSVVFAADGTVSSGRIEAPFTYASGGLAFTIKSGTFDVQGGVLSLNGTVSYGTLFTVTFTELRFNASGIVSMGTLRVDGENVSAYGFQLHNPTLTISQGTGVCTVDATIELPNSIGKIAVTAQFSSQGSLMGMSLHDWSANPTFSGFALADTKSELAADGLTLAGNISLPSGAGKIPYTNLKISPNGIVQPPQFSLANQELTISGYTFKLTSAQFQNDRLDLSGEVDLGGGNHITVGRLSFSSSGSITTENLAYSGTLAVGGLTVTSGNLSWTGNAFLIDLAVTLPSISGTVNVTGVKIGSDGSLSAGTVVVQGVTLTYQGLTATVTSCSVDFKSGKATLTSVITIDKFGKLEVDDMVVSSSGIVDYGKFKIDAARTYTVGSYAVTIQSIERLGSNGLTVNAKLAIAGVAEGFGTVLNVTPQVVSVQSITVTNVSTTINGFTATLSKATLGIDDTLRLDGTLTLGSHGSAAFTNLTMTTGGRVCGANITMTAGSLFTIGDMAFSVTRLAFNGQALSLDGTVTVSGGGIITITNANLKSNLSFTDGTITATGPIAVGGFNITLTSGTLSTSGLSINGTVSMQGITGTMSVEGVRLTSAGATSIDKINLNNVQTKMGDFQLTLDSAAYTSGKVVAAGTAVLPQPYGTLRVTDLQVSGNGTVSGGQIVLSGSSVTYGGVALSLTSATLVNNTISITGGFTLQKQGITGTVTGLTLTAQGVQNMGTIVLGQKTVTINDYSFTISSCTITQNKISIDGSMKAGALTINAKGLTLTTLGTFTGGVLSIDPSTPLKINGMTVDVTKLDLENDHIEIDGSVTIANGGIISLKSVNVKPDGSFINGTITYGGTPLGFAGGTLQTATMTITGKGFRTDGKFTLPGNLVTVGAYGIVVLSSGVTGIDSVSLSGVSLAYNGFVVTPTAMRFPSTGISIDGTVNVPTFGELIITNLTIGIDGSFRGGTISASMAGWTWKGYTIQIQGASIAVKGISIDGTISIPGHGTAKIANLLIDPRGLITGGTLTTSNLTFSAGGFSVNVTGGSLTNDGLSFSGTITLPNSWGTVGVSDLHLTTNGLVQSATLSYSGSGPSLGGFSVVVTTMKLDADGLSVSGTLTLPASVTGKVTVNDFVLSPQGTFSVGSVTVQNVTAKCGDFTATLDSARYANNQFSFSGTIPLPGQYGTVSVIDLTLESTGILTRGTLMLQGSRITHNGFVVTDLSGSLINGNIVLGGSVVLPNGLGTATLSGLTLSGSTVVSYGAVALTGSKTITWQTYSVTVDSMLISQGRVSLSGSLTIKEVGTVKAKNLCISPQGEFSGGTIILEPNTSWTYNGFVIAVTSAEIQHAEVEISGTITIPKLDKSLTLSNVNFPADGIPNGGTITYNGPPFAYKGYQLTLTSVAFAKGGVAGTATFAFGKSSGSATITISNAGAVSVTEFAVKNVSLAYAGFAIDNVSVQMVGDSVEYSGSLTVPQVGTFTVQNMIVSTSGTVIDPGTVTFSARTFSYNSYMITVDSAQFHANALGLTGSIQLPDNKGVVRVTDLIVSTTGKLSGGTISTTGVTISHAGYTLTPQTIRWEGDGIEMDATFTIPQAKGTFTVQSFEIGLAGKVNMKSITYAGPDITFGEFTLTKVTIHTSDLSDLSVDGTVQLPPSVGGEAIISGLRFMTGDVSVQKIVMQNATMKYNSFTVTVDSITYANKLMVVTGKLGLPDSYGTLGVVGLAFDSQGKIQGGTITAQNVKMTYDGFELTLSNATMGMDGILTLSGSVKLPNTAGTMTLTGFKMDGTHVVDMGNAVFTGSTITWQAYTVMVDTVELLDQALLFDGSVKIGTSTTVRGENLKIDVNGKFLGGTIDIKGLDSIKVAGFVVNLSDVQVSATGLTANGSIIFPNDYGTLTATKLTISADGKISDGPWIYVPAKPIIYNGATLTILSVMLQGESLTAKASLLLPNGLTTVTADDVTISYPWNLTVGSITVANAPFTYNGYVFTLVKATYSGSDLVIDGKVDAPNLGQATFTGLKISTDGHFSGGTVAYSNAWKWGSLDVVISKATYDWEGKIVTITGSVTLPQGMGNASVDSLIINTVTRDISNVNVRATGTYTYGGRTFTATAYYANKEIELDGKIDLSPTSYVSVSGLDISVDNGSISGGKFTYVGPGLSFGGCVVTIDSVLPTLKSITITATVDLPGNLGAAQVANATFNLDGSFKADSVIFYGQTLSYNSFTFTVTHGVLTSNLLQVDALVTVGGVTFGIDDLLFTGGKFSGGRLDFSMTKLEYKGYTLKIISPLELPGGGYRVNADFKLPESKGFGRINGIDISTTGFDFSKAQIDWSSMLNLLPPGFSLKITKAEFVDKGFEVSGTLTLSLFCNLALDGLIVTPDRIALESAHFQVADLTVGTYKFSGLTFDFQSAHPTWLVHMNGTVKLPGNFEGFTLDGTIDGKQNFSASLIAKTKDPILIGNTGTELIGAGGGIKKEGSDYQISLIGIFAPVGMQKTLNGNGTLVIDANGKISGVLDVKLLDLIPMAKATMVIDIPTKKFTVTGKAGFHRILSYDGGMNIDAKPFKATGNGNVEIDGIALAQSSLLMDEKVFSATGQLKIPDPASSLTLVEIDGTITVVPSSSAATMAGTLSLLGYSVSSGNLTVSDDSISASGQINLGVATGNFNFLATQTPPPPTPNTPDSKGGGVVPDVAGFLKDHPEEAGSIDLAIDVIQAEYPDIYQELVKDQQEIRQEKSAGRIKVFGSTIDLSKMAKERAQAIAQHVTSIVDLAGLDPNEFETNLETWLLGQSLQPSFERAAWASRRPPLKQTPEIYASLSTPTGKQFTVPLSALTQVNDRGPKQVQTLDLTSALSDLKISLPDWTAEPQFSCDQDFGEMLELSEAEPFAGFKLKSFTASVAIKFRGLTFDKTTVSITGGTFQGTTKVTIPGIGSGTVTFTGTKSGVTSFSGDFDVTIHGFSLSAASVSYTFNGSKANLSISGTTSFIGTTFSASSSVSETGGTFSVDSFTLRGAIGVHWNVEFRFKWKIFKVHFSKTLDLNFGSATFTYNNSSLQGGVSYCIDFPWPIHKKCLDFGVDITPHNVRLGFNLYGDHTLNIGY